MSKLILDENITISEKSVKIVFVRASGPGGQKVNKTSSAAQLFVKLDESGLEKDVLERLCIQEKGKISEEGVLMIEARENRSQTQNKEAALNRLRKMIKRALKKERKRIPTKTSRASIQRRLNEKKKTARKKQLRRNVVDDQ